MSSMLLKSTSGRLFVSILSLCTPALGNDFQYFSKGVDYWNENSPAPKETVAKPAPEKRAENAPPKVEEGQKEPFSWEKHLDPKNKEFFREGDYTPPEPFMELVRNPSDENLKMWFAYVDRKNELAARLHDRMTEYLAKNGGVPAEQKNVIAALAPKASPIDAKRYRLRLYFNSTCPHCQKMFGTLKELQAQGFYIEARQLDREAKSLTALPFPVDFASPQEAQQKNIQSVPLLLIGDLKRKVVYRLTGFQTTDAVISAIQQQSSGS